MTDQLVEQARGDAESVTELACALIREPSRGGVDDHEPIVAVAEKWLVGQGLPCRRLAGPGGIPVGLACEIVGGNEGPAWVLDACLDTAPFGDLNAWSFPPTAGDVVDGWIRGRGAADSKTAAAMFCHLARAIVPCAEALQGTLTVLLDVDEHTGTFGGAQAFVADSRPVSGVLIGYPGLDEIVVGGRGVFRVRVHVFGEAGHSGTSKPTPSNAVVRGAHLVNALEATALPRCVPNGFPLPPKLTVTEIRGGESFSTVPDHCLVGIDIRLTDALDATYPASRATTIETITSWPPYQLGGDDQPAAALLAGAMAAGINARHKVAGPSNIGNFLAGLGIPSTAGFGLPYQGLHGPDERAHLEALPAVQAAYHHAALSLLGSPAGS
ncbi:M20 family metallopeptidase [Amycolatopsis sp. H20-H5]|uniref:M20 family metallopeptidase n=1 Tax=Amycolatopsis sp. H20-H5 TaxID=3046309 RepID=UPI002DBAC4AB|nr:M20/M25/M40 family metallo-hydrolase [Amycolatopsis sp. H20-H5]MEC3979026.1 M20/M25/M40 family metallo-hydrolase [Amycolatopsis sp. H20-H5]